MSSILNRGFNQAPSKSTRSNSVSAEQVRERLAALAPKAGVLFAIAGLATLIALSVMNNKLFFNELLISSFIILALIFFKASAAPRK